VRRAIDVEVERQKQVLAKGGTVIQQTRGYDADKNITTSQRDKEEANDYRYLPCPDLPPFEITDAWLEEVKAGMPELPETLFEKIYPGPGFTCAGCSGADGRKRSERLFQPARKRNTACKSGGQLDAWPGKKLAQWP
jgi:Asp-tRNA(Asn)/Glu-tRNA(Gln) amidotransferase B subunit